MMSQQEANQLRREARQVIQAEDGGEEGVVEDKEVSSQQRASANNTSESRLIKQLPATFRACCEDGGWTMIQKPNISPFEILTESEYAERLRETYTNHTPQWLIMYQIIVFVTELLTRMRPYSLL